LNERIPYEPDVYLQYKIIIGDVSDNIPPIMKKCGPKTAEKLAQNAEELAKIFDKHPDAKTQYDLNRRLIDFSFIDEEAKQNFLKNISFV
jgi:5'-3' exonuclease